jgi:hypothetical protein
LEDNFKNKLDILRAFWTKQNVHFNSGISQSFIDNFQNDFGFKFENNFLIYLTEINGFIDYGSDVAWFCFWDLDRMKIENSDASHPKELIWFSDHSINLCSFGFNKNDKKVYTHFDRSNDIIYIANNFSEFVDIYLDDPYKLIM